MAAAGPGMAEKKEGESSDSEAYLSADEGLASSRGGTKEVALGSNADVQTSSLAGEALGEDVERHGRETKSNRDGMEGQKGQTSPVDNRQVLIGEHLEEREPNGGSVLTVGDAKQLQKLESSETKVTESHVEGGKRGDAEGEGGEGGEGRGTKEEKESTPIPPPRRKRKKKLQRNPSLEDLERSSEDSRMHRSMTVGSADMSRERKSSTKSPLSPSPLPPSHSHPVNNDIPTTSSPTKNLNGEGVRGNPVASPDHGVRRGKMSDSSPTSEGHQQGTVSAGEVRGSCELNAPSILIEPNTSLELTEDMVHGQSEVMTRDTPLAKAYGSDKHETEIIFDSDDESDGEGVYGSQELRGDHSDSCPDGDTEARDLGQSPEVVRGGGERAESDKGESREETTPLAGEGEGDGKKVTHSPSDNQILQMTIVKNLDTGDSFPLSVVDEKIPLGNPLNQHLYRRTAAMESHGDEGSGEEGHHRRRPHLKKKLRHFWGKKKTKQHGEGVARTREGETVSRGHVTGTQDQDTTIKYKPSSHHKGPYDFDRVRLKQDLTGPHLGAVWVMEFSICGRLLAIAGQDSIVRVFVLRTASQFFHELQAKYQRFGIHSSGESLAEKASMASTTSSEEDDASATKGPFLEVPICTYHGHAADILDLSWSKNFFLLSSSMDKTVRLWHISRKECLCCFQHVDFVTAIAFHPRDDRYFLSGSLDGKLRLWNIPDKRVALWNEIEGVGSHLITAANFCMNGKLAVAGTYDGRCIFYETEHLKYHTQIHVKSRHGKNRGRKISGIEPLPGEDKILVTSNDSRLRLYNLKDHSLSCKYKGGLNTSSQIRATFSRDGLNIICGSEDHFIYVWRTHHDVNKLSSVRRDRNEFYESFSTHHAPVTAAVFAPVPGITVDQGLKEVGQMIIAADYQGSIKVYVNSEKL